MIDESKPIDKTKLKIHIENQEWCLVRRQQYLDSMEDNDPHRASELEHLEELRASIAHHKELLTKPDPVV